MVIIDGVKTYKGRTVAEQRALNAAQVRAWNAAHPEAVKAMTARRKGRSQIFCGRTPEEQRQTNRARSKKYHERCKERTYWSRLLKSYGVTKERYTEMNQAQGGLCAICLKADPDGHSLSVDHDHVTGAVRSLLCKPCNVGLANFREDPQALIVAATYLRAHSRSIAA